MNDCLIMWVPHADVQNQFAGRAVLALGLDYSCSAAEDDIPATLLHSTVVPTELARHYLIWCGRGWQCERQQNVLDWPHPFGWVSKISSWLPLLTSCTSTTSSCSERVSKIPAGSHSKTFFYRVQSSTHCFVPNPRASGKLRTNKLGSRQQRRKRKKKYWASASVAAKIRSWMWSWLVTTEMSFSPSLILSLILSCTFST
ncbi:hypothetical protein BD289DRAFT_272324 [Coniella lustricola]|uniref:Uncharacterized protein n=1 Tax=Coniella lustricola TaxID=2025994 RepID=A0A2T3AKK4_9PEZI|nr:hypothetical protein BD289DRAFT_272324 [Coniella lustricola]